MSQGQTGIAVLVDELQDAGEEGLRTIAYAWQELQGSRTPAVFVAAGLSHTADVVTAAVTSAERFQFRTMWDLEEHKVSVRSAAVGRRDVAGRAVARS